MELAQTMKLYLYTTPEDDEAFTEVAERYASACDDVSQYVFDHGFILNAMELQDLVYYDIRDKFGLKSQMAISVCKTVVARYSSISTQMFNNPYRYHDEKGKICYIPRTLEWLQQPVHFRRPQVDLVRRRDYSFTKGKLSINTLRKKRILVDYERPECFEQYFDRGNRWKFGTAKLVKMNGHWYLHISMTKKVDDTFDLGGLKHMVGADRGIRNLVTTYNDKGKTDFVKGRDIQKKRERFAKTRAELQSKGTKSAKRVLKRISGRENRWMTDINHRESRTLVNEYGPGTLFVLEDLTGVSFSEQNLSNRDKSGRRDLRSWPFYQFEQFLEYKANAAGSKVVKVKPDYTSQRCPKCGRILKTNRKHEEHMYVCDKCGYKSNDDRVAAMNLYQLGQMYARGVEDPHFGNR